MATSVPQEVREELARVVRRWRQLTLGHAVARMPLVRRVLAGLTDADVPDLGPGVVMDQLAVLVYDACAAGQDAGLAERLAGLRRALTDDALPDPGQLSRS